MRLKITFIVAVSIFFMRCTSENKNNTPILYTVGDSTVKNGQGDGAGGLWGWGDFINQFVDTTKIKVQNEALGGTSSRTYIQKGLWQEVLENLKSGDYVLIQFGHNDAGPINDNFRARGTIKGIGEEKEKIKNQLTGAFEVVHTYGWYIRKMVRETKEKGGIPIVMSPIPRNNWKNGKVVRNNTNYGLWSQQVAQQEVITFVDLNRQMAREMELLGEENIYGNFFYKKDHTHTTAKGAVLAAGIISQKLKESNNFIKKYFLETPSVSLPKKKNVYLIGDSTMAQNGDPQAVGWGVVFSKFTDTTRVRIINRARGGRSSRTFYYEKLWASVYDSLNKGDYVLIQFGHNDGGHIDQPKYRGSIKGTSDSTMVVHKKNKSTEVVHSYGWYIDHFVKQTLEKGAKAVVLSSVPRNRWNQGKVERNDSTYGLWARQIAIKNQVPFIDLNDSIAREYEAIGAENIEFFFPKDHTHTSANGATFNAAVLAQILKQRPEIGLKDYVLSPQTIDQLKAESLKNNDASEK